jgi:single-strand DNA-binding protein
MAKSLNRVTLIGNLGQDPELRSTPTQRSVVTISLATTDSYKDKDGEFKETTDWHKIVFWDSLAETVGKYLRKGSKIYAEGRLKTRSYEDSNGVTRYVTEIIASSMLMLDSKGSSQSHVPHNMEEPRERYDSNTSATNNAASNSNDDEDIPF